MPLSPILQQGQPVESQQCCYVVTEIRQSVFLPDPLQANGSTPQNVITLRSMENDAFGEEIQVIWELEPDTRIIEQSALPELSGFDDPQRFDTFLNVVRWGTITSAGVPPFQTPFRSGIAIKNIHKLCELRVETDQAMTVAYIRHDLDLDHGFHKTKQGVISPS